MAYVTVPLTSDPAIAVGGTDTEVVTSATGEMAVVPLALSGSVFGPWLIVVVIDAARLTDPVAGALYAIPMVKLAPLASVAGIAPNVTAPLAASYDALAPAGRKLKTTFDRPGGNPSM